MQQINDRSFGTSSVRTIAVAGAGRLAHALVRRIPSQFDVLVLARSVAEAQHLERATVVPFADMDRVRGSAAVLLALPPAAISETVERLEPHLDASTVVVNMATESDTRAVQRDHPRVPLVAAKLIGQARAVEEGSPGVVLVDYASPETFSLLSAVFDPLGIVLSGPEDLVLAVNSVVAQETVAFDRETRTRLKELRLPEEAIDIALSTMAVGIIRALTIGDIGPFLRRFVEAQP